MEVDKRNTLMHLRGFWKDGWRTIALITGCSSARQHPRALTRATIRFASATEGQLAPRGRHARRCDCPLFTRAHVERTGPMAAMDGHITFNA
eukprot:9449579-Pyramimonas_sp.AAC.1